MGAEGEIFQSRARGTGRKGDGEMGGDGGEMGEGCGVPVACFVNFVSFVGARGGESPPPRSRCGQCRLPP